MAYTQLDLSSHLPGQQAKAALADALTSVTNALEIFTPDTAARYHSLATTLRDKIRAAMEGGRS